MGQYDSTIFWCTAKPKLLFACTVQKMNARHSLTLHVFAQSFVKFKHQPIIKCGKEGNDLPSSWYEWGRRQSLAYKWMEVEEVWGNLHEEHWSYPESCLCRLDSPSPTKTCGRRLRTPVRPWPVAAWLDLYTTWTQKNSNCWPLSPLGPPWPVEGSSYLQEGRISPSILLRQYTEWGWTVYIFLWVVGIRSLPGYLQQAS